MKEINVAASHSKYKISISSGVGDRIVDWLRSEHTHEKYILVTDATVDKIYGDWIVSQFKKSDLIVHKILVEEGEKSKSLDVFAQISEDILEIGISRKDALIAFGGGVIGDLTGFLAATLLRGIDFFQIPTTLLAQIDSSVGGKVGINSKCGKNLIGAFYPPKGVLIDPKFLKTLSKRRFCDGMAEAIKYAFIKDFVFYEWLKTRSIDMTDESLEHLIATCCNLKKQVVEKDEFESGERMLLNFGHTLGHVIETYYGDSVYTHGEAVALGMLQVTKHSETIGLTREGTKEELEKMLKQFGLPTQFPKMDLEKAWSILIKDKKNTAEHIQWIILKNIGESDLCLIEKSLAHQWLEAEIL